MFSGPIAAEIFAIQTTQRGSSTRENQANALAGNQFSAGSLVITK